MLLAASMQLADWHQRYLEQAGWTKGARDHLLNGIKTAPDDFWLEIGCGTGALLQEMAGRFDCRHLGIDIDLAALHFCHAVYPDLPLTGANGLALPLPSGSCATVYCHFLLLWVPQMKNLMDEMARVLRIGGRLFIFGEPDHAGRIDYPATAARLGQRQTDSLQSQGTDIEMGRKLQYLLTVPVWQEVLVGVLGGEWRPGQTRSASLEQQVLADDLAKLGETSSAAALAGAFSFVPTFYASACKN